jgi:hypothetical protein
MFASHSLNPLITMLRAGLMAGSVVLLASSAAAAPLCKPVLAFKEIRFSAVQPETMERHWTASLSVDASQCATTSGRFEILFSRLKENGPEVEFVEPFTWKSGSMEVSVVFWADEAVEGYWLNRVASCPCRE